MSQLLKLLKEEEDIFRETCSSFDLKIKPSQEGLRAMIEILALVSQSPLIPIRWINDDSICLLRDEAENINVTQNS